MLKASRRNNEQTDFDANDLAAKKYLECARRNWTIAHGKVRAWHCSLVSKSLPFNVTAHLSVAAAAAAEVAVLPTCVSSDSRALVLDHVPVE